MESIVVVAYLGMFKIVTVFILIPTSFGSNFHIMSAYLTDSFSIINTKTSENMYIMIVTTTNVSIFFAAPNVCILISAPV